ncbi:MAG: succinate dehydrogenase [Nitrospinota bacterium]
MANVTAAAAGAGLGVTKRHDAWWVQPLVTGLGLGIFGVYATWAALQGNNYYADPYLSPFYSPLLRPDWWPFSPAILILWAPLGFRATCYYYRKAYYRAYFLDPPACAVEERSGRRYRGETAFPFILQNLHRYFLYLALIVLGFLWYDTFEAFFFPNGVNVGVGTLVLLANVVLLSYYTFSCHSFRYLIGGNVDCFACVNFGGGRHKAWSRVSGLNRHHMLWAWTSLIMVGVADLYVRLVASGVIQDRTFF